jgi:hypothetical protein
MDGLITPDFSAWLLMSAREKSAPSFALRRPALLAMAATGSISLNYAQWWIRLSLTRMESTIRELLMTDYYWAVLCLRGTMRECEPNLLHQRSLEASRQNGRRR